MLPERKNPCRHIHGASHAGLPRWVAAVTQTQGNHGTRLVAGKEKVPPGPPSVHCLALRWYLRLQAFDRVEDAVRRGGKNTKCDGRHCPDVSHLTQTQTLRPYKVTRLPTGMEAGMLVQRLAHVTTEAVFVAMALMLGLPFFLAMCLPFIGR